MTRLLHFSSTAFALGFIAGCTVLLTSCASAPGGRPTSPPTPSRAFTLRGDIQTFDIQRIVSFPFIEAEINGTRGLLMLDTGTQKALDINDHVVKLEGGVSKGSGFNASDNVFEIRRHESIREITLGKDVRYEHVTGVTSYNMSFLEHLVPNFLGFVGFDFFQGYLFKLDYFNNRLTFYRDTPERRRSQDFLSGEKVVSVIDFETRRLPNHPIVQLSVGETRFVGAFDTGQQGMFSVPPAMKHSLIAQGRLQIRAEDLKDEDEEQRARLEGVRFPNGFQVDLPEVHVQPEGSAVKAWEALGIPEDNRLVLGYGLLNQFKTVWDFEQHRIYLLER